MAHDPLKYAWCFPCISPGSHQPLPGAPVHNVGPQLQQNAAKGILRRSTARWARPGSSVFWKRNHVYENSKQQHGRNKQFLVLGFKIATASLTEKHLASEAHPPCPPCHLQKILSIYNCSTVQPLQAPTSESLVGVLQLGDGQG